VRERHRKCSRKQKKWKIGDEKGHPETKNGRAEGDRGSTNEANGMSTDHIGIGDIGTSDRGPGLGRDQETDTGAGDHTQDRVVENAAQSAKIIAEQTKADQLDTIAMVRESSDGEAGHRKVEVATMTAGDDENGQ